MKIFIIKGLHFFNRQNPFFYTRRINALLQKINFNKHSSLRGLCTPSVPLLDKNKQEFKLRSIKSIKEKGENGQHVRVQGWVRNLRKQKTTVFVDLVDGSSSSHLPIVISADSKPLGLTLNSSVDISGTLSPVLRNPDMLELHPTKPLILNGTCDQKDYPFGGKIKFDIDHYRQYQHLRFKTSQFSSLMRIRSEVTASIHSFFHENGYTQIHTPIITGNDCEGAGETFLVRPSSSELIKQMRNYDAPSQKNEPDENVFFDKRTYLTVSSQLHLEAAAAGLGKVWSISPVFRAENAQSTRHLSEFYMVEAEVGFAYDIEEILVIIEKLVKCSISKVVLEMQTEWSNCTENDPELQSLLENIIRRDFTIMTLKEASNLLKEKASSIVIEGKGLSREQELTLVKLNNEVPIFVIDWPKVSKPFYMRDCNYNSDLVSAVDLLVPRVGELAGGSLRENSLEKLQSKISAADPSGNLLNSLHWYLDLRKFGSVPSGGFGIGFDRLIQLITGRNNIKDINPFPRWPHGCQM